MARTDDKRETSPAPRYAVRLDPQHPHGQYHRAGYRFGATSDVFFEDVPVAIREDPWLMVTQVEAGAAPVYGFRERVAKQTGRRR